MVTDGSSRIYLRQFVYKKGSLFTSDHEFCKLNVLKILKISPLRTSVFTPELNTLQLC